MTFHPPTSHTNDAFITDSNRWRALVQRNRAASSSFVYAVRSTNIYCRPTCPSRLARRANIVFYDTAADAEAAGFRACKRCKPGGAADEDPALDQGALVRRACEIVREEAERGETLGCAALAKKVGLSVRYFHGLFKRELGVTPQEYARKVAREVIIQRAGDGGDKEAVAGTEALQHTLPESLDINAPLLGSFDPFQVTAAHGRVQRSIRVIL
ncbi:metal binding domain of Ada-domain-containing protein [Lineolata rhizophorae]|uniref:Metal binding domain of Ada-domain-containing protein n=1 Tax=Lineolata rhizophorae TaxID=578093 RepID=A0A6A6NPS7_9PEZI|nr:metal binding domain of Ada-domain-containing protein [Lineolata rhizophorae]